MISLMLAIIFTKTSWKNSPFPLRFGKGFEDRQMLPREKSWNGVGVGSVPDAWFFNLGFIVELRMNFLNPHGIRSEYLTPSDD